MKTKGGKSRCGQKNVVSAVCCDFTETEMTAIRRTQCSVDLSWLYKFQLFCYVSEILL